MARHGHAYVPSVEGNFTQETGERAMLQLLEEHPDIDGVFVANDLMALGAVLALRDAGRRVPEDVAVVGFDDSNAAQMSRPPLTTIRQPLAEMAQAAATMAITLSRGGSLPQERVEYATRLVIRASTSQPSR
jgi:DNA-binding LacI/PurR family transcriptional regulator